MLPGPQGELSFVCHQPVLTPAESAKGEDNVLQAITLRLGSVAGATPEPGLFKLLAVDKAFDPRLAPAIGEPVTAFVDRGAST